MAGGRIVRRKRLRKRRRKLLFSIMIVLFLGMVGYTAFQVAAGQDQGAENGGYTKNEKENDDKTDFEKEQNKNGDKEQLEDNKINVLLVGSDQRDKEVDRTDTIMIGQYDKDSGETKLVSIMRDTYVNIPGYGYNKINASYAYGDIPLLTKTIQQNFGIQIDHFAEVNFEGFKHIVDEISPKGIKINVEKRMKYQDNAGDVNIDLQPGVQRLDGAQLLDYARFRADAQSDFGRVERQQKVITRLKEEMLSLTKIHKIPKAIGMVTSYVNTDMTKAEIGGYGTKFITNHDDNIQKLRIPVEGSYWNERYEGVGAVLAHNEKTNRDALQEFLGVKKEEVAKKEESGDAS
ncbi:LCP family protein [Pontibacillus sp. HMF3514]|uniref:LCP family protein n=1 Tax=Pontibacillus sp. HMF3514 TaxID=2692425 RepID=UPI00131FD1C2|nr:LCP family protein [Pontibacillus sp. HMF3514]QHE51451.1 LytR family transcriptional regulator [Pontibacillus sp. HMF3514]